MTWTMLIGTEKDITRAGQLPVHLLSDARGLGLTSFGASSLTTGKCLHSANTCRGQLPSICDTLVGAAEERAGRTQMDRTPLSPEPAPLPSPPRIKVNKHLDSVKVRLTSSCKSGGFAACCRVEAAHRWWFLVSKLAQFVATRRDLMQDTTLTSRGTYSAGILQSL